MNTYPNLTYGSAAADLTDQAAQSADSAIRSTQRVANETLNGLSDRLASVRDAAVPAIDHVASEAARIARGSLEAARDRALQLRESAHAAGERSIAYAREKPVRTMLLAAAAGAIVALLFAPRRQR